tara:strand:- start:385 stop:573 length:189 start_codon:yes stop_codon:yes gene_type:complete
MPKKTYICHAKIAIRVEADDEFDASSNAGMEMDIGDIDWDVEELTDDPLEWNICGDSLVNIT